MEHSSGFLAVRNTLAHRVRLLAQSPRFKDAERITLVCDNLSTHKLASLYMAFSPEEALAIARRLEIVHIPVHGSWLNISEIELSVLTRQCLDRRIDHIQEVAAESLAWCAKRNRAQTGVDWHFTTEDARTKLKHTYPQINL